MDRVATSTLVAEARRAAAALVDREEVTTGSRLVAYERVAQLTGASSQWIRKFVNNYPEAKTPTFVTGHNLLALYARMQKKPE